MAGVYDLRYDQVCFKASHNSFDCAEQPVCSQLDRDPGRPYRRGCRGLELDLVQSSHDWEWCVKHGGGFDARKPLLSELLEELGAWSDANPGHDPVTVHLDIKNQPRDDTLFPEAFDRYVEGRLDPGKLFRPAELIGGEPDLMRGVRRNGWPTLAELRGKLLFCLSGREATKARYAAIAPKERLCFADLAVATHYDGWRPRLDRGDRVFFNFYLATRNHEWDAELPWYANQPGLVTRGFVLNLGRVWARALRAGVSVLATDQVSTVTWSTVGPEPFAPRGGPPPE